MGDIVIGGLEEVLSQRGQALLAKRAIERQLHTLLDDICAQPTKYYVTVWRRYNRSRPRFVADIVVVSPHGTFYGYGEHTQFSAAFHKAALSVRARARRKYAYTHAMHSTHEFLRIHSKKGCATTRNSRPFSDNKYS